MAEGDKVVPSPWIAAIVDIHDVVDVCGDATA
jgi:hypothetical protein